MSSQVKITDYFVSLKSQTSAKSSVSLRSGTKKCVDTVSSDLLPQKQTSLNTPKRKLIEKHGKSTESSSKRIKTPRNSNKNDTKTGDETDKSLSSQQMPKQMTAKEVRETLGKCSNLTALREKLVTINDCADKLKKFKEMKIASPVKIISTPLKRKRSPPVKAYSTPKKTPTKPTDKLEICSPTYRRRLFDIEANNDSLPTQPSKSKYVSVESFLGISKNRDDNNTVVNIETIKRNTTSTKITKGDLKGLSLDFLIRIRAKQAAKLTNEKTQKPEIQKQLDMMKRFPQFIDIIILYFNSEKKKTIRYDDVVNKIMDSYDTFLAVMDTRQHLDFLIEQLPDWIWKMDVKIDNVECLYIQIEKNKSIDELKETIDKHAKFIESLRTK